MLECGLKLKLQKLILQQQERRSYAFLDPSNNRNDVPTRSQPLESTFVGL
jgi:hypothetical protein